jgi:hypothetical protein
VSDMILHIHSDAPYSSLSNACSHRGGIFFSGDKPPNEDVLNDSILNVAAIIKNVVASAAESEVGACFQRLKVARQSKLPSLNWDTSNLRHHYGQITQPPLGF